MTEFTSTDYEAYFSKYYNKPETFSTPEEADQVIPRTIDLGDRTYTKDKLLTDPDAMGIVRMYMKKFNGTSEDLDDEEVVDDYLARMRKFSAGQSVVTLNELRQVTQADEQDKVIAGQAYDVFDRMEGIFSGEYTWEDKYDGFSTYARAVVVDPTNLIGLGIGRLVGGSSTKAAAAAVKTGMKAATVRALKQLGSKGAAEAAELVAKEGIEAALKNRTTNAIVQQASRIAEKQLLQKELMTAPVQSALKRTAIKSVAATTASDSAMAVGVDIAYQNALIKTGQQEDYYAVQTGVAALAGVVGGFLDYGLQRANRLTDKNVGTLATSLIGAESQGLSQIVARNIAKDISGDELFNDAIEGVFMPWTKKVAEGQSRKMPEMIDIWNRLLLGNDEENVVGLVHVLKNKGIVLSPRNVDDNPTNFFLDILRGLPEEKKEAILKIFNENVRNSLGDNAKNINNFDDFTNSLAKSASDAGRFNWVTSAAVKELRKEGKPINADTVLEAVGLVRGSGKGVSGEPRKLDYYQNTLIQLIVSHPGTTALNVLGSTFRGGLELGTDVIEGLLYGSKGLLTANKKDLMRSVARFKAIGRLPKDLISSGVTGEKLEDFLNLQPHLRQDLFGTGAGGVDFNSLKMYNMDKAGPVHRRVSTFLEGYKDTVQKLFYTRKQDEFFKTQAFWYSLNKNMMSEYGKSIDELMGNAGELMTMASTKKFQAVQLKSVDDALLMTFSKSYKDIKGNPLNRMTNEIAAVLEDIKSWPVIGAAVPFGRFFNNTVDAMADFSGAKLAWRITGAALGGKESFDTMINGVAKTTVGLSLIYGLSQVEENNIKLGLAINEEQTSDGQIIDNQFDFPYSFFKYTARLMAHLRQDGMIPKELFTEYSNTFGPAALFRTTTTRFNSVIREFQSALNADNPLESLTSLLGEVAGGIGAAWVSGYTRPLDVINEASAVARGEKIVWDRKSGNRVLNNSLRYVDNIKFVDNAMEWFGAIEKESATVDDIVVPVSRIIGWRTVNRHSSTQKMLNAIGRPQWMIQPYEYDPEINNKIAGYMQDNLEIEADVLINSKRWTNMDIDQKKRAVDSVLERARAETKKDLDMSVTVEDRSYGLIRSISDTYNEREIQLAMREYGLTDVELIDLHPAQLGVLQDILERQRKWGP